ncbi:Uncharacterised protein [Campylobacter geochelonis]|nr:Uncharacterised protein [Campylobacter geochelonis]
MKIFYDGCKNFQERYCALYTQTKVAKTKNALEVKIIEFCPKIHEFSNFARANLKCIFSITIKNKSFKFLIILLRNSQRLFNLVLKFIKNKEIK